LGQQKYKPGEWTSTEKKKEGIEVGHLMTKVVVGFLCEGVGRGNTPPKLMRYHLPLACCFCQGCEAYGANRADRDKNKCSFAGDHVCYWNIPGFNQMAM
jgi:hypothetical protein